MIKKEKLQPVDVLNQFLEKEGLRKTPERNIILDEIYKINKHFDVDELFNIISKKNKISKATVYNTIELFHNEYRTSLFFINQRFDHRYFIFKLFSRPPPDII